MNRERNHRAEYMFGSGGIIMPLNSDPSPKMNLMEENLGRGEISK